MQDAVYALPGFMPPSAPNWKTQLFTQENGSIKLCVHCGVEGDKVYYSLDIPGWNFGFIKDPKYFEDNDYPEKFLDKIKSYSQYLSETDTLDGDTVIPKVVINDWPIPITERKDIENKKYWILDLPAYTLPVGDTEIQVIINGRKRTYVVHRPEFSIHRLPDMTDKKIFK